MYADIVDKSVNLVSSTDIQTLIKLQEWTPLYLCSASSQDLLVIVKSDDLKETKVVRYSGSIKKQSIQWENQDTPFYLCYGAKYLSENRNLDICVADCYANAVVVVNGTGSPSTTRGELVPAASPPTAGVTS